MPALKPSQAIDYALSVARPAGGARLGTLAGSCWRAYERGDDDGWKDLDWFVPTPESLMSVTQLLLSNGGVPVGRYARIWERWNKFGIGNFWTNSMQVQMLNGLEINIVYKTVQRKPIRNTADVLGSFDFGFLCSGYDLTHDKARSMITYQFPDYRAGDPYPMVDERWKDWSQGYMSQHVGLREGVFRYPKYYRYGEDMTIIGAQLVQGYEAAAEYLQSTAVSDKMALAEIYLRIADHITNNEVDMLEAAQKGVTFDDPLDKIMEALE